MKMARAKAPITPSDNRQRDYSRWLMVTVVLTCLAGGLVIAAYELSRAKPGVATDAGEKAPRHAVEPMIADREAAKAPSNIVQDDGTTMWMSPTAGPPFDLSYLPAGCQLIVAVRPEAIVSDEEVNKTIATLLALAPDGWEDIAQLLHSPNGVQQWIAGCRVSGGSRQWTQVVRLKGMSAAEHLVRTVPKATTAAYRERTYLVSAGRAYFVPKSANGSLLVVAPAEAIHEIIDSVGKSPPLRRDMERLFRHLDAERDLTLLVAPNFLFGEGQEMFRGEWAQLRGALFWFLGDGLSAAAFSADWGEDFFLELAVVPTLDLSAEKAARELAERVRRMPEMIEKHVVALDPKRYGRSIVERFPAMLGMLARFTRSGVDDGRVVLRCFLPRVAGHNLILGAALTLADSTGRWPRAASTQEGRLDEAATPGGDVSSVERRLDRPTSLTISRDSLEAALSQLSQLTGVEIVIVGPDLQAEGITRNQLLELDIQDKPASEILVQILLRANPDRSAPGPADRRQQLVYVVESKSLGRGAVFVTTRSRALERGDKLPAVFVAPPGP
jgi:hypothetical protein